MSASTSPPLVPAAWDGALSAACQAVADELFAVGLELPSVYLLRGSRLRCFAARGYDQVLDGLPPGVGVIGEVVRTAAPLLVPDVRTHEGFIATVSGLRAEACVPVVVSGQVVGVVNVESRQALPSDTLDRLERAATRLGRRISELGGLPQPSLSQRLAQVTLQLTGTVEAVEVEQRAVHAAADLAGMSSAAIVQLAPKRPGIRTACGPLGDRMREWRRPQLEAMAGWVGAGTSSYFPGGSDDVSAEYLFVRAAGVRGLSVHPLVWRGTVTGLLVVADRGPIAHSVDVVECLELLAAQTASQLMVAAVVDELERQAEQDGLTGLRNASSFAADLAARAAAPAPHGSLLLLDVDHFKEVNDAQGHLAGDSLLKRLSAGLTAAVRADDRVYRIGGDELAVLTDAQTTAELDALAQRLLHVAQALGASVSIGTSPLLPEGPDDTRSAADAALYLAKAAGRGTVRHAAETTSPRGEPGGGQSSPGVSV